MKSKVISISCFLVCIMFLLSIYFGMQYYHHSNLISEKNKIKDLIQEIHEERKIIQDKSKQLEEIKNKNKEKNSLLEVWLKEKEKLNN